MDTKDTFLAVFIYPGGDRDEFSRRLPIEGSAPPVMVRASTTFEGAQAVDIFRLVDAREWPHAAAFLYAESVPGTIRDGTLVEQVVTPDD